MDINEKKKNKKELKQKKRLISETDTTPEESHLDTEIELKKQKKDKKDKKNKKDKKDKEGKLLNNANESQNFNDKISSKNEIDASSEKIEKKKKDKSDKKKDKKSKKSGDSFVSEINNRESNVSSQNFYVEHDITKNLETSEIRKLREENQIQLFPETIGHEFKPITQFLCLNPSIQSYCPYVKTYLDNKNFTKPTPIQSECWPLLLSGKDVIGIAATGSGKTLTFLIPGMLKIARSGVQSVHKGTPSPQILIIAPTRELAMQSQQVVQEIHGPKGVCIYGGIPKHIQKAELNKGVDIVVATPGRLIDLIDEGALKLSNVKYLVLDEADRMLDDGFEPAIRKILSSCPGNKGENPRQTVMFSATWPEEIRALAETFLREDTVRVTVGSDELSANHRVTQIVECVEAYQKDGKLNGLLNTYHKSRKNRILIFVLYKKEAAELQRKLQSKGFNVTAIHGDKSQNDRTAALEEFKSGSVPLLIATDVAARGLDIPQVEYVINYSFPLTVEDYVHRIGRTGRGGSTGISHTFFTDFDKSLAGALVAVLKEANQEVPQEIYKYPMVTKKKQSKLYGDFGPKSELAGKKATKIIFD